MRILQLVQMPQRRGAETFAFHLSEALRRAGDDVGTAYLYPAAGPAPLPLGRDDVVLANRGPRSLERLGADPILLARLARHVRRVGPDIVQLNGGRSVKYGAFLRLLRADAGAALVYRNIGDPQAWQVGLRRRVLYRHLVLARLDGVAAVSEATRAALAVRYGLSVPTAAIPVAVAPHATEPARPRVAVREAAGAPPDAPVVLWVGHLAPEKRIDLLLSAFARVRARAPGARLWLLGDGPLRRPLERRAGDPDLAGAVRFWGRQADVASLYAAADAFALSSDTEGLPAVLLEAGWHGLPAVATRVGATAECIHEGATGLLVPRDDVAAFADALLQLVEDAGLRRRLGDAARTHVRAHYALDRIAARFRAFYEETLARRAEPTTPL